MSTPESNPNNSNNGWAKPVDKIKVGERPKEAINLNVDGRQLSGLTHGFGQLWQKTYRVRLSGVQVTPQEVISAWKANFPQFWPEGNNLYNYHIIIAVSSPLVFLYSVILQYPLICFTPCF